MEGIATKSLEAIQRRDELKRVTARQHGITLVAVPCWWDNKLQRYSITQKKNKNNRLAF